jgi:PEGA domain
MARYLKYFALALLALAVFVPAASARPVVFVRGYFGPAWYGPAYYGWYGPAWVAPYPYVVAPAPNVGKVKIETKAKDAMVYVDGGYAGTVGQLKTFPLRPGTHDIELRDPSGHAYYQEHVDVIAGKTIKLVP